MFDVTQSIEEKYLWNFSPLERALFHWQHRARQEKFGRYEQKVFELIATDSPAIFANYEPKPSTSFEIKYTLNRIRLNDPRETELTLSHIDPIPSKRLSYAKLISWAFKDNTYCQTVVLNGVLAKEGWHSRGFNDLEAEKILDVLSDKKLKEFTFTSYPLLTDVTYLKIGNILARSDNHWSHVTLGDIAIPSDIANLYERTGKVSFRRIERKKVSPSFFSRVFHREHDS